MNHLSQMPIQRVNWQTLWGKVGAVATGSTLAVYIKQNKNLNSYLSSELEILILRIS